MNFGLITSFFIAGVLLMAILSMNMSLSRSSNELTLSQMATENVSTVAEMVTYDVRKIGYDLTKKIPDPILKADSTELQFYANLDNTGDVEEVLWRFTNQEVGSTSNPDDYVLLRRTKSKSTGVVVDKTDITLGVTDFKIRYYDTYGADKSQQMATPVASGDLSKIKQIEVEVVVGSPEKLSGYWGGDEYINAAWEKRFSPGNLENN